MTSLVCIPTFINYLRQFKSTGVKRYIASITLVAIELLRAVPGADLLVNSLISVAGLFGATGTAHAALKETLGENRLATLASLLGIAILIASFIPEAAPYMPLLHQMAAIVGGASVVALSTKQQILKKLDADCQKDLVEAETKQE